MIHCTFILSLIIFCLNQGEKEINVKEKKRRKKKEDKLDTIAKNMNEHPSGYNYSSL